MSGRFFLDTNVFVYAFDSNSPEKAATAKALIREGLTKEIGIISYQVIQEFLNVALRRFKKPMTTVEAESFLGLVLRPMCSVQSSHSLYGRALAIRDRYRLSWWDSLIIASAIEGRCARLYTEDLQNGLVIEQLIIENPFRPSC
jgi:predicted nucleic acid-binding protein